MRYALVGLVLLGVLPVVCAETAKPRVTEFRRHFQLVNHDKASYYKVTVIVRMSEEKDENLVLIQDEGHGDFILSKVWSFGDQSSVSRLSDLKGRTYMQASYTLPLTAKTRTESLAEARANPMMMEIPALFTLETNGGRWEGLERDWDGAARLRDFRRQIRQTVDFSLLEAVERMRGTLFSTDVGSYFYSTVCRFVIYDPEPGDDDVEQVPAVVQEEALQPNCDFDKRFGFPCTEKQLDRVKKAIKEQRLLDRY